MSLENKHEFDVLKVDKVARRVVFNPYFLKDTYYIRPCPEYEKLFQLAKIKDANPEALEKTALSYVDTPR